MRGAIWRQEQATRRSLVEAYTVAMLSRAKKIPPLEKLLAGVSRNRRSSGPHPPALQRELILAWASRLGLKVERHEHPVI